MIRFAQARRNVPITRSSGLPFFALLRLEVIFETLQFIAGLRAKQFRVELEGSVPIHSGGRCRQRRDDVARILFHWERPSAPAMASSVANEASYEFGLFAF